MKELLDEIDAAVSAGLYRSAMLLAFVVPDHAAALADVRGRTDAKKYQAWVDDNLQGGYSEKPPRSAPGDPPWLSGHDCWRFRCSLLHESDGEDKRAHRARRIAFGIEGGNHMGLINDLVLFDLRIFVGDMTRSARAWLTLAQKDEWAVYKNLKTRIRLQEGAYQGVRFGDGVFL